MEEAVEVLEKVTGVRTPESKGISLIQLNSQKYPKGDVRKAVVNLLKKAGNTKQTKALNKLADKIMALKQTPGAGVFPDQEHDPEDDLPPHVRAEGRGRPRGLVREGARPDEEDGGRQEGPQGRDAGGHGPVGGR